MLDQYQGVSTYNLSKLSIMFIIWYICCLISVTQVGTKVTYIVQNKVNIGYVVLIYYNLQNDIFFG